MLEYLYVLYVSSYLSVYVFFPFLLPSRRGLIDLGLDFSRRSVSLIFELKGRDPCVGFDRGIGYYIYIYIFKSWSVIYISSRGSSQICEWIVSICVIIVLCRATKLKWIWNSCSLSSFRY